MKVSGPSYYSERISSLHHFSSETLVDTGFFIGIQRRYNPRLINCMAGDGQEVQSPEAWGVAAERLLVKLSISTSFGSHFVRFQSYLKELNF